MFEEINGRDCGTPQFLPMADRERGDVSATGRCGLR
jgi:hypothetical protein